MQTTGGSPASQSPWSVSAGTALMVLGQISPILGSLIMISDPPTPAKSALFRILVMAIPNLSALLAAVVLGKRGFSYLMEAFYRCFAGSAPPERVGPVRYRIGLFLFFTPVLFGWLGLYFESIIPGYIRHRLLFAVVGDLLLLISLFVLGGEFWDKLRALFSREARVVFRARPEGTE